MAYHSPFDSDSDTPSSHPSPERTRKQIDSSTSKEKRTPSTDSQPPSVKMLVGGDSDSNQPMSDDSSGHMTSLGSSTSSKKTVAIDTSQNEHFSHRLIPTQSPEFENVISQVWKYARVPG